jgi:methyl-accepting chemotaxis protein
VVAKEVRELAERSKVNAMEINGELTAVREVAETTKSIFEDIDPLSVETDKDAQEINAASKNQQIEIEQITKMISALSKAITQFDMNASTVGRNSTTVAESSQKLKEMSDYFKVS